MTKKIIFLPIFLLFVSFFFSADAQAYKIQTFSDTKPYGDYVLGQGKIEAVLNPGDQLTKELTILNRSGSSVDFKVEIEDFSSSENPNENISLLGITDGPYSLKDYLQPELRNFTLKHGEQITLPVLINIPADSKPGGLYAAVIFSGKISGPETEASAQVKVVSRLASLFFVRVNGEIKELGQLQAFDSDRNFYFNGPVIFDFTFKNDGNIYLNPNGELIVSNLAGQTVATKNIFTYYVMPNSERRQKEIWQKDFFGGIYKATLKINRGYGSLVDQQSVYFIMVTVKLLVVLLTVLVAGFFIAYKLYTAKK